MFSSVRQAKMGDSQKIKSNWDKIQILKNPLYQKHLSSNIAPSHSTLAVSETWTVCLLPVLTGTIRLAAQLLPQSTQPNHYQQTSQPKPHPQQVTAKSIKIISSFAATQDVLISAVYFSWYFSRFVLISSFVQNSLLCSVTE